MAKTRIPGIIIAQVPPWTRGTKAARGYVFKRAPKWMDNLEALSVYQLKQCLALAKAAEDLYGTRGKLRYKGVDMPAIAVKIAPKISGSKGGKTRAERSEERHRDVTPLTISRLESLIREKGG